MLEVLLAVGVVVLYDASLDSAGLLALTIVTATVGLAAAGTLYGVLAAGLRVRETLLPAAPAPGGGAGADRRHAGVRGGARRRRPSEGWPWVGLLGVFALVYTALGLLAFGPLLEES